MRGALFLRFGVSARPVEIVNAEIVEVVDVELVQIGFCLFSHVDYYTSFL